MALQQLLGSGLMIPRLPSFTLQPAFVSTALIDATGEIAAISGRVCFPARTGTKNISRVAFRWGAITKAGGSALTISLQDVDLVNGPPFQPDGIQDQTVAVANADAAFLSNTWYRSGALSATRPVSCGDLLSVVVEYDGGGRLGADSVVISALAGTAMTQCGMSLKTGGVWALLGSLPNVVLEFDDGTFGTLEGATPFSAITTNTYNVSTGVTDEYALVVNLPFVVKIDALWAVVPQASGADFEVILYSGTTALVTVTVDQSAVAQQSSARQMILPISEIQLDANTDYYVAVRPTTTNSISVYQLDVSDANHWTTQDGGIAFQFITRLNQGAWAAKTATKRILAGVRISSLNDGTGGMALSRVRTGF